MNDQFVSVFTEEDLVNSPTLPTSSIPTMSPITINTSGVEKLLKDINPSKASGPDAIPAKILKECAASIAPILSKIYQKSLNSGHLPQAWLDANVTPIYKKGDRTNPGNYRPVSLTSIPCKLLEHILHHHIMDHFDKFNILVDVQHGFRKGRSCDTQLSALVNDLAKILDNKSQADLIIMDFSKAFDSVPHQRLLMKLDNIGIRGNTLKWISSFLTNRHQQVILEGVSSIKAKVTSGVPQGTVLGPLLFLAYINDLPSNVSSKVRLFADDCILYKEISTQDDADTLQNDLNTLVQWEKTWQMSFNASKCFAMRITHKRKPIITNYHMDNITLKEVSHHPYLGVELSSDLKWSTHINNISTKANKILGLLKRNIYHCDTHTKAIAYKSLVRPILEYCSTIWDPHHKSDSAKLERIQHRAARFAVGDYRRDSSITAILNKLDWESLQSRRTKSRLIAIYKETHGFTPNNISSYLQSSNSSRVMKTRQFGIHKYNIIATNKDCYRYSLYPKTLPQWNSLPTDVRCAPDVKAFKIALNAVKTVAP